MDGKTKVNSAFPGCAAMPPRDILKNPQLSFDIWALEQSLLSSSLILAFQLTMPAVGHFGGRAELFQPPIILQNTATMPTARGPF